MIPPKRIPYQLGGLMSPGLPQPTSPAGVPALNVPAPHRPSFLERLMPTPRGMAGLLTPEDLDAARRMGLLQFGTSLLGASGPSPVPVSLGQAVGQAFGAGMQGFQGAVGQAAEGSLMEQQMAKQKRVEAARQRVAELLKTPGMNEAQRYQALQQMFAEAYANGDTDVLGAMSQVVQAAKPTAAGAGFEWVDMGGKKIQVDAQGNPTGKEMVKTPSPRDPNAPDTAEELRNSRRLANEDKLYDDFNRDTRETREMAHRVAGAIEEAERAKAGDGMAQVNLLYAFISAMDPGTAVKEGETALVRSAGSLVQQAGALVDKFVRGESVAVPAGMIDQMANLMRRRLEGSKRYVSERVKHYRSRGARFGVDPSAFSELDVGGAPPPAAAAGAGSANRVRDILKK